MQKRLTCNELYTKLTGSLVVWENEVPQQGCGSGFTNDKRYENIATSAHIGSGQQYAIPRQSRRRNQNRIKQWTRNISNGRNTENISRNRYNRAPLLYRRKQGKNDDSICFRCGKADQWRAE